MQRPHNLPLTQRATLSLLDRFLGFVAMPIYVFRCESCGEKFERLQKMSDADPDACPHCGAEHSVRRQVTAPAFRLAGSGWYETDFKSDKEKKHNLAGDAAKPAPAESKPAADKPASKPAPTETTSKAAG